MSFVKNVAVNGFTFAMVNAATGGALIGATVTCKVNKDGAGQVTSVHSATEVAGGEYVINFDAAEFNATTVGLLFTATEAIPVHFMIKTVVLNVDVANVAADLQTIKGQTVNCAGVVTVLASVGTAATSTAQSGDGFAIINRVFSGITSLAQWLGLLGGKQAGNATARTELNATGAGGGTFDETADSLEAIRHANVTVGAYAANQDPATLVLAGTVETGVSLKQAIQRIGATTAGKLSGSQTGSEVFVGLDGLTTRVTVTADASGNRTAVVYS